jgi:MFS family permease
VLVTTGSAAKTGLVGFFATAPLVLAAFFGGAFVNRLGFKATSVAADLASGVAVAAIPLLYHTVGLAFWQLLALVFLGAVLDAPASTARQSLFPDLAALGHVRLERANAATQATWRLTFLLGPPLAGVLIAVFGASNVLWLDAASFGISAALIGALVPATGVVPERAYPARAAREYLADLAAGLAFVRRDRLVLVLAAVSTVGNALGASVLDVALPVYARHTFDSATALGFMLGGFGGGALLGVLLYGAVGYRLPRRALFVGALLLSTLPYWIIAAAPSLPVAIGALVLDGLAAGPYGPIVTTVYQERVPAGLRGQFFGTVLAVDNATTPPAIALTGYLIAGFGLPAVLVAVAAVNAATAIAAALHPALRQLDAPGEGAGA